MAPQDSIAGSLFALSDLNDMRCNVGSELRTDVSKLLSCGRYHRFSARQKADREQHSSVRVHSTCSRDRVAPKAWNGCLFGARRVRDLRFRLRPFSTQSPLIRKKHPSHLRRNGFLPQDVDQGLCRTNKAALPEATCNLALQSCSTTGGPIATHAIRKTPHSSCTDSLRSGALDTVFTLAGRVSANTELLVISTSGLPVFATASPSGCR